MKPEMKMVNLGCGDRLHPDWINIDIVARRPGVIEADLSRGIPLADSTADVVYHAAVLEHLRRPDALTFLRECRRVLKPGGIIRVGVPDLEGIVRLYLQSLEGAVRGDVDAPRNYEWMMLELLDQVVREESGGAMAAYLRRQPIPNEAFVIERIGQEGQLLIDAVRNGEPPVARRARSVKSVVAGVRRRAKAALRAAREGVSRGLLTSDERRALAIGEFRLSGEVHQWMYDRYSLERLLTDAGFEDCSLETAETSRIPNWPAYHLDADAHGRLEKPDLIFMEGKKAAPETRAA
jgi:predicted SAM-dependent methyltransferase